MLSFFMSISSNSITSRDSHAAMLVVNKRFQLIFYKYFVKLDESLTYFCEFLGQLVVNNKIEIYFVYLYVVEPWSLFKAFGPFSIV